MFRKILFYVIDFVIMIAVVILYGITIILPEEIGSLRMTMGNNRENNIIEDDGDDDDWS
jgi:hypothetical protein